MSTSIVQDFGLPSAHQRNLWLRFGSFGIAKLGGLGEAGRNGGLGNASLAGFGGDGIFGGFASVSLGAFDGREENVSGVEGAGTGMER